MNHNNPSEHEDSHHDAHVARAVKALGSNVVTRRFFNPESGLDPKSLAKLAEDVRVRAEEAKPDLPQAPESPTA